MSTSVNTSEIVTYLDTLLNSSKFKDYAPNGLQVSGYDKVSKIVGGTSANLDFLHKAIVAGADTLLVHHGWFWRGDNASITGINRERIKFILNHNLNLIAYHLPLDAHPVFGNNAQLASLLDFEVQGWFGDQNISAWGKILKDKGDEKVQGSVSTLELADRIEHALGRKPLVVGNKKEVITSVAWCSGGGQNMLSEAINLGVDAFISGEISEQHVHIAKEAGVTFFAVGHYASERGGVQALGNHLKSKFNVEFEFVDVDNPV